MVGRRLARAHFVPRISRGCIAASVVGTDEPRRLRQLHASPAISDTRDFPSVCGAGRIPFRRCWLVDISIEEKRFDRFARLRRRLAKRAGLSDLRLPYETANSPTWHVCWRKFLRVLEISEVSGHATVPVSHRKYPAPRVYRARSLARV
jgi:hypothetical protein